MIIQWGTFALTPLPCGHVLAHQAAFEDKEKEKAFLQGWLAARAERHVCELVSPENPSGLPDIPK